MILEPNQTTSFCCLASKFSNCFNSLLWSSITRFYCHFLFPPNSPLTPPPFLPFIRKRSHFSASCWPSFFNIQALSLGQFQCCSASTKVTSFLFLRFQLKQTVFNDNSCELMGDLLAFVKTVQFPLPRIGLPIILSEIHAYFQIFITCIHLFVDGRIVWHTCESQSNTCQNSFPPYAMKVQGDQTRSLA